MKTQHNSGEGSERHCDDHLTETQARAQELPMSLAWFRRKRIQGGGPPFIKVSNRIFYRRGALRQWIADLAAKGK